MIASCATQTQVKVNVRLCGSIPRLALSMMQQESGNVPSSLRTLPLFPSGREEERPSSNEIDSSKEDTCATNQLRSKLFKMQQQPQHHFYPGTTTSSIRRPPTTYEAPSWAVPANGEARLEPVCDSVDRQEPVDLKSRAVFRIGRSPQSDVHLMHVTSSRRHAMLFHHANGSCYLVDCGSAHGTYINGVRVVSTPNDINVVVPTRVRRGSIVRFGGPGAPSYMLKSFSFDLEEMREGPETMSNMVPSSIQPPSPILSAMVQHNTRLNSLGKTAKEELMIHRQISSKRSFDSMSTVMESDYESDHPHQSSNSLTSPPLSPEQSIRLISPEINCSTDGPSFKRRRVTFPADEVSDVYPVLVSPDVSSDEHENEWDYKVAIKCERIDLHLRAARKLAVSLASSKNFSCCTTHIHETILHRSPIILKLSMNANLFYHPNQSCCWFKQHWYLLTIQTKNKSIRSLEKTKKNNTIQTRKQRETTRDTTYFCSNW